MQKGIVYKSTGSWYVVKDEQGMFLKARLKGKLKIDNAITSTNPIAVGDTVLYEIEPGDTAQAVIKAVEDRKNYIVRVAPQNRNQKHILAANLDQAILLATLHHPRTSSGFIDRFLITAEAYHIPAVIIINKTDRLKTTDYAALEGWKQMYEQAGYPMVFISALKADLPAALLQMLQHKTTLVCGHSGVGKSTLLNRLLPRQNIKTDIVSAYSGKGMHTTTFAEMYDLPTGGHIIDTPGVKELGIIDMDPSLLAQYYPEMRGLMKGCKFNDCTHRHEPGCAVRAALEAGNWSEERYKNYLNIFDSITES